MSTSRLTLQEYETLVEQSPILIWRANIESLCDYFNDRWLSFRGRTMEQEYGNGWAEGVHPDDFDRCLKIYLDNFNSRNSFEMEYRLMRHDGNYRWIFDRGVPFYNDNGDFAGFIGSCIDVTDRVDAQEALRLNLLHEQSKLLNLTHDSIIVRTMDNVITFWNNGAAEQYGWQSEELVGKASTHDLLKTIFPAPLDEINELLLRNNRWEGELTHTKRDGSKIIVSSRWVLKRDEHGIPIEIMESNNDITERKAHEEQLEHLSTHDVLTGLYNRTFYEAELSRLTASRRYPVSVIVIDLDGLKHINDTYGHAAGDNMIRKAATIIMNAFRAEDLVARTGGDEFVVLLPETSADGLKASIERLQRCLEDANKVEDGYDVKFSVGTAIAESKDKLLEAVKAADAMMYQDKAERKILASNH